MKPHNPEAAIDRITTTIQESDGYTGGLYATVYELLAACENLGLDPRTVWVYGSACVRGPEGNEPEPPEPPEGPPPCTCQQPWSSHGNYEHAADCPAGDEPCIYCGHDGRTYDGHVCEEEPPEPCGADDCEGECILNVTVDPCAVTIPRALRTGGDAERLLAAGDLPCGCRERCGDLPPDDDDENATCKGLPGNWAEIR